MLKALVKPRSKKYIRNLHMKFAILIVLGLLLSTNVPARKVIAGAMRETANFIYEPTFAEQFDEQINEYLNRK